MYFVHLAREIKSAVFINRLCYAFMIRLKLKNPNIKYNV